MKAYEAVSDGRLHLLAQEAAEIVQAAVKAARAIERGEHSPDQGEEEGSLLPLPRNSDATPALRRFVVENQADLKLTPAVFYRGRVDAADRDVLDRTLVAGSRGYLVVRLEGTNVEEGKEIIRTSGLNVIPADDLDDAAQKIVAAGKKG